VNNSIFAIGSTEQKQNIPKIGPTEQKQNIQKYQTYRAKTKHPKSRTYRAKTKHSNIKQNIQKNRVKNRVDHLITFESIHSIFDARPTEQKQNIQITSKKIASKNDMFTLTLLNQSCCFLTLDLQSNNKTSKSHCKNRVDHL